MLRLIRDRPPSEKNRNLFNTIIKHLNQTLSNIFNVKYLKGSKLASEGDVYFLLKQKKLEKVLVTKDSLLCGMKQSAPAQGESSEMRLRWHAWQARIFCSLLVNSRLAGDIPVLIVTSISCARLVSKIQTFSVEWRNNGQRGKRI